jgi:hypothetical protein
VGVVAALAAAWIGCGTDCGTGTAGGFGSGAGIGFGAGCGVAGGSPTGGFPAIRAASEITVAT